MNANLVAGAEVFRHVDHQAGRHGGRFVAGAGGSAFDARRGLDDFHIHGLRQLQRQHLAVQRQHLHARQTAFRNEQQFVFDLVFLEDVRRVVFVIHEHVFFAVDIGEVHLAARQGNGVQDIVAP